MKDFIKKNRISLKKIILCERQLGLVLDCAVVKNTENQQKKSRLLCISMMNVRMSKCIDILKL